MELLGLNPNKFHSNYYRMAMDQRIGLRAPGQTPLRSCLVGYEADAWPSISTHGCTMLARSAGHYLKSRGFEGVGGVEGNQGGGDGRWRERTPSMSAQTATRLDVSIDSYYHVLDLVPELAHLHLCYLHLTTSCPIDCFLPTWASSIESLDEFLSPVSALRAPRLVPAT